MNTSIILIGGNLGNRVEHLQQARELIHAKAGEITAQSALYETAPWGNVQQPDYLNQALQITTSLDPAALLAVTSSIEQEIGRVRQEKWGARVIDIDIIFFNNVVIQSPQLELPHPRMHLRRFVLVPMADIVPSYQHPLLHKSVAELLHECPDHLPVHTFVPVQ
ncbi:2-amino-4-hydroxy-6-hydroxymethyldihydropteridine diphosphokinase [Chitinophaga skermanii]|uniref:2-amino-4-hydroxy-6-hydroxymethyldihydropteridine pyrophosphokinase n=1 Tax=Chitinophaga skermanii TaxID=331697 RepID=A0A327QLT8_9BACT|nr:2-amino-4-hydroxy-6-hydroxymethyldihydropteridine diphosphokinase [Chitinophaga skermanii]RAJ05290.1 2-amino-4-hydroxy-6-hydroxymethyldihydropteridine diphosphokinase [Chitinophaga skermanii]